MVPSQNKVIKANIKAKNHIGYTLIKSENLKHVIKYVIRIVNANRIDGHIKSNFLYLSQNTKRIRNAPNKQFIPK